MSIVGAGNNIVKSAGKPLRANQYRMEPGMAISPHDIPIGKKQFPGELTVNMQIPES